MTNVMSEIPPPHPLQNKPLVEVIFEVRWELDRGRQPGLAVDPGFRIFMGRYYDRMKDQYPHVQDLPASQVPDDMTAHTVRHQFWRAKDGWPVTQIGPGILTVNETEGYLWESFRPRLIDSIKALYESYPTEIAKLKPSQVTLKYIDAVAFDSAKSQVPLLRFLRESLHTGIDVEPLLFARSEEAQSPLGLNLTVTYGLEKPKGAVVLTVANGTRNGSPAIIWETTVISKGADVPNEIEQFGTWLDGAHAVSDNYFFTLVRGELLLSFEAKSDADDTSRVRD
ncbi:MAG: TIGR04255 family protein [Acidobacteria bacterium]|nr:TIGR04255 family protein [Acidobacteriota bacterium]